MLKFSDIRGGAKFFHKGKKYTKCLADVAKDNKGKLFYFKPDDPISFNRQGEN